MFGGEPLDGVLGDHGAVGGGFGPGVELFGGELGSVGDHAGEVHGFENAGVIELAGEGLMLLDWLALDKAGYELHVGGAYAESLVGGAPWRM